MTIISDVNPIQLISISVNSQKLSSVNFHVYVLDLLINSKFIGQLFTKMELHDEAAWHYVYDAVHFNWLVNRGWRGIQASYRNYIFSRELHRQISQLHVCPKGQTSAGRNCLHVHCSVSIWYCKFIRERGIRQYGQKN